ncbi:hypothetical protein [Microcystis aeruginosa]|uniref:hypothetical protein n=1 Tax=Microcystis aeruginosa TaxID=1126 RepID=UPI000AD24A62|nr:hypothetical protein [Microcystis aeruginosa]
MKMGKTPHPTPHTLHPAPRKNFFSRPQLHGSNYLLIISIKTPKSSASNPSIILLTISSEKSSQELTRQGFSNQMYCISTAY